MSRTYPFPPPPDAKEWACPQCGCDVLWCGCSASATLHTVQKDRVMKSRCKYDRDQIRAIVNERGIDHAISTIDPSAIGDAAVKEQWQQIHSALDMLAELLGVEI